MQLAAILGENNVKLVPDISVAGTDGQGGLVTAMIARLLASGEGSTQQKG